MTARATDALPNRATTDNSHDRTDKNVEKVHGACSGLTIQAQRPGAREATMATATRPPGSLQRMVRPTHPDDQEATASACPDTNGHVPKLWVRLDSVRNRGQMLTGQVHASSLTQRSVAKIGPASKCYQEAADNHRRNTIWNLLIHVARSRPNDPSSATRRTERNDCNPDKQHRDLADSTESGPAGFAAAHG
jgi:hypothetical protein